MKQRKLTLRRCLFLGHRYLGLTCAAFVLLLAITGILLNHTDELALDEQHVNSPTLLDWYGIRPATPTQGFLADGAWFSVIDGRLFIADKPITEHHAPLQGVIAANDVYLAAFSDALLLISHEGELIEKLTIASGLPSNIRRLGLSATTKLAIIDSEQGLFTSDAELLAWQPISNTSAEWASPQPLPPTLIGALRAHASGDGLSIERILLDVHSGRIIGSWGVYLMDGVAIAFLLLAIMGVWMWARQR